MPPGQPPPSGQPPPTAETPAAAAPPGWGSADPQWTAPPTSGYQPSVPAPTPGGGGYPLQSEERTNALWAHLGSLLVNYLVSCGLLGWIVPLVIRNGAGARSPFVRFHATESLNFSITIAIASVVSGVLMIVLIGFILWPLVIIGGLVLQILASVKANSGEWYRYPINLRMISD